MKALFLLFIFLPIATFARIGETAKQCKKRYGKPVTSEKGQASYEKAGIVIKVIFLSGKCHFISFSKADETKLSEKQIAKLLKVNGRKWIKVQTREAPYTGWINSSAQKAKYHHSCLAIQTDKYWQAMYKAKKKQEADDKKKAAEDKKKEKDDLDDF